MRFVETRLAGTWEIELEPHLDDRGFFARAYCEREFGALGLVTRYPQSNLSLNTRALTLRGMHFQAAPHREAKIVRCVSGAIHDVVVDLRVGSPTRLQWVAAELTARNRRALYVPPGCAHGFLTLEDDTEVLYQMGEYYVPEAARGFRWDDPFFRIAWPATPLVVSERDGSYPGFDLARCDG